MSVIYTTVLFSFICPRCRYNTCGVSQYGLNSRGHGLKGQHMDHKRVLVNTAHYNGVLVKLIPIHQMISSINIYSCVLPLSLATKQTSFSLRVQALSRVHSLLYLKETNWFIWQWNTLSFDAHQQCLRCPAIKETMGISYGRIRY